jgi:DNA-binding transcriptional regulator YiaG
MCLPVSAVASPSCCINKIVHFDLSCKRRNNVYEVTANDTLRGTLMISGPQLRAARSWLGLSQGEVASRASVGRGVVAEYERGARIPYGRSIAAIREVLEAEGIEFLFDGERAVGIRLMTTPPAEPQAEVERQS